MCYDDLNWQMLLEGISCEAAVFFYGNESEILLCLMSEASAREIVIVYKKFL